MVRLDTLQFGHPAWVDLARVDFLSTMASSAHVPTDLYALSAAALPPFLLLTVYLQRL